MAEDESLVRAIENAGLLFIGPCSSTVHQAGLKDEAKRMALAIGVSTVPGVNDLTVRTLLTKAIDNDGLDHIASQYGLQSPPGQTQAAQAEALLAASYSALIDVITIDEIVTQAEHEVARLFTEQPNNRIRLKAISGGGGKGQHQQQVFNETDKYGKSPSRKKLLRKRSSEVRPAKKRLESWLYNLSWPFWIRWNQMQPVLVRPFAWIQFPPLNASSIMTNAFLWK